jgi:hypothetical protein
MPMERQPRPTLADLGEHYASSCVVALLGLALQLPVLNRGLVAIDEGQIASFAERILRGEVIYRDFYTGLFPGIYYFSAGLFATFGRDLLTMRVAQLAVNVLIGVLIHRIALSVSTPFWSFLWAASYFPLVIASFPTLTMLTYSPLSMMFALGALLCALRLVTAPTRSILVTTGTLLAACGLMKQNYGGLAVAAVVSIVAGAPLLLREAEFPVRRALGTILAAGGIATGTVLAPLLFCGAGPRLFRYTVGTVLSSQLTVFHQPIPPLLEASPSQTGNFLFFYLPNVLIGYVLRGGTVLGVPLSEGVRWTLIRFGYGGMLLVLALGWALLLASYRQLDPRTRLSRVAVMVFAQLMFLGLFPSAIWSHLATIIPPILIVGAVVCGTIGELAGIPAGLTRRTFGSIACGICTLAFVFAAQITRDVRRWNATPTGLAKANLFVSEQEAKRLQGAVAFLHACAGPGRPIFVAPDLPVLYFVSGRPNATPYEMLIPGDIDENLLVQMLNDSATNCIVYNPQMYSHFAPLAEDLPGFVEWMNASFAVHTEIGSGEQHWLGLERRASVTR